MDRTGRTSRTRLSVLAVAGALLLAGCSGSDDDEPTAEPSNEVIEVSPTDDPSATTDPDDTESPDEDPTDSGSESPSIGATPEVPDDLESASPSATPTDPGGVVGEVDPDLKGQVPDLCRIFSASDFERVTGLPAEGSPEVPVALATVYSSCSYAGPSDYPTAVLTAYSDDEVDDILDDGAGDDDLSIDDAEWSPRTGLLIEIDDADWTLQVRVTNQRGRPDKAQSLEVARVALGNL